MKKSTTYEKKSSTKQAIIAKRPVQGIEIKFKDLSKTVKDFIYLLIIFPTIHFSWAAGFLKGVKN